jgi:hypothetical protein
MALVVGGVVVWIAAHAGILLYIQSYKPLNVYKKYPYRIRQRLTLPLYQRWRTMIEPGEVPQILAWRRMVFGFVLGFWAELIVVYATGMLWIHHMGASMLSGR